MRRVVPKENIDHYDGDKDFRCLCGSLLARLVPQGVELKCRRCKRQVIVPLEDANQELRETEV
jgi:phage FluMu protein Com